MTIHSVGADEKKKRRGMGNRGALHSDKRYRLPIRAQWRF